MNTPIQSLKYNILHYFETISTTPTLTKEIKDGLIAGYLTMIVGDPKAKSPFANEKKEIYISESYLAFLWAFIYGTWVQHEEDHIKTIAAKKGVYSHKNTILIRRAQEMANWATVKNQDYTKWDTSKPNPQYIHSEDERFYIEKVNNIFIQAVGSVLFHEKAHIILGHVDSILADKGNDFIWAKEMEKDADTFAIDCLIDATKDDDEKLISGIAVMLSYTSWLFLMDSPGDIMSIEHPNLDERIFNLLERFEIRDESHRFYIYSFASNILYWFFFRNKQWFDDRSIQIPQHEVETAKDLFDILMGVFDSIKANQEMKPT